MGSNETRIALETTVRDQLEAACQSQEEGWHEAMQVFADWLEENTEEYDYAAGLRWCGLNRKQPWERGAVLVDGKREHLLYPTSRVMYTKPWAWYGPGSNRYPKESTLPKGWKPYLLRAAKLKENGHHAGIYFKTWQEAITTLGIYVRTLV